ncbi:MAG: aminotransferase class I/II-fold pyridoxal phosphate-dependent enzyme [Acidobacteria bacterium]|nr:aminotransferase class I/II-fold pyridoxal phosphate-dependent enzyme [Acidobacteriota bacterium]
MLQYVKYYVPLHNKTRGGTAASIAASVENEVHSGRIQPGSLLPTVRDLGGRLKVSPATVAAAYKVLRRRGLVTGAGRGGTRVAMRPPSPVAKRPRLVADGVVDLASGNPDPALLPPLAMALGRIAAAPHLYGDPSELRPLMQFIRGEFEADGVPGGSLALVSGALDGIERVLREHLRPGDLVGVEDPSFPGLLDLLASAGYGRVPIAIDDDGPVPASFKEGLRRVRAVIVTSRAQNPTGAALTATRAKELRLLSRRRPDVLLIENDPCGPVAGVQSHSLTGAGAHHWAVVRSTSKFLGPDLRLAALAGDELTIARVEGRQALGARWVSTILQQFVLALWGDPGSGRWIAHAANVYAQRRDALVSALAAHRIPAHGRSGFHVWIPVREEAVVVQALADRGWGVMAGERCRIRSAPAIRVTTAALFPDVAERLAADLATIAPMGLPRPSG